MSKPSDRRLSDTLSARSYLDPAQTARLEPPEAEPARDDNKPRRKRGRPKLEPTDKSPDEVSFIYI